MDPMVSEAPTPHSPPIATPKIARSTRRVVRFGEKPEANSMKAYNNTSTIRVGRPPEHERTYGAHRQCQQNRERHGGDVGVELRGDILEHEYQEKKVKGVERP